MVEITYRRGRPPLLERFGKTLREAIKREPLPERWTELLKRLNREERDRERERKEGKS
jgi:hypothetical protein